jgi:hypothetical protein
VRPGRTLKKYRAHYVPRSVYRGHEQIVAAVRLSIVPTYLYPSPASEHRYSPIGADHNCG